MESTWHDEGILGAKIGVQHDVGIQTLLLMKLLGEFQNFLLAGVELGLESVSLPLKLYPIPFHVFERGGHVRMKDSVWKISFHNRIYDN